MPKFSVELPPAELEAALKKLADQLAAKKRGAYARLSMQQTGKR